MVFIENLLHFTNLAVNAKLSGIFIPQDNEHYSIYEISKTISKGLNRRIIFFKLPDFLFNFMCTKKKKFMASLYGTLVFDSRKSNEYLGYTPLMSAEIGLLSIC